MFILYVTQSKERSKILASSGIFHLPNIMSLSEAALCPEGVVYFSPNFHQWHTSRWIWFALSLNYVSNAKLFAQRNDVASAPADKYIQAQNILN